VRWAGTRTVGFRYVLAWLCVLVAYGSQGAAAEITSRMLVEARDITSVSPSPDGTRVVIGISRANIDTNKREVSWVIVPLRNATKPIALPAGEEIFDPAGPGSLLAVQPRWSSDGQWFFYLRREGEEVQLWETDWKGQHTKQVTHSKADLVGLSASADLDELNVRLAPDREVLRQAERDEDRVGILYDDHVLGGPPLTKTYPIIDRWRNVRRLDNGDQVPPGWTGTRTAVFDMRRRELRVTAAADEPMAAVRAAPGKCGDNCAESAAYRARGIALGELPRLKGDVYRGQYVLQLEAKPVAGQPSRTAKTCVIAECMANRITAIGWSLDETEVYFVADSRTAMLGTRLPGQATIYAWDPVKNIVRLIFDCGGRIYTLDGAAGLALASVDLKAHELVVAEASADEPPRLIAIDLNTGVSRTLFDPNAELRLLTRGRATWRTWPTSTGYPGRGVVVLPDGYQPVKRYPLIITTYACGAGFLRGGSGDNAPEFVAVQKGFIAVCVDVPVASLSAVNTDTAAEYHITCDILSALIVDLDKDGSIDPARVGLTGQSFGANVGTYCMSHAQEQEPLRHIAAASFRHGSAFERARYDLFETATWRRDPIKGPYALLGMPDPHHDPSGRWQAMSVALRAADIKAAVLFLDDDTEYLYLLPLFSAMRDAGCVVELRVFPEETHLLMQPVHQWMNFEQQIDWFRFWLKGEEDEAPSKQVQYQRWRKLQEGSRERLHPP
jgi:dipeptidyl aminopeptidase/acylaminoacyl peptidase